MDALGQSDALMRRGDKLRAQSVRIRASADERWRRAGGCLLLPVRLWCVSTARSRPGREGVPQQMICPRAARTAALSSIVYGC